MAGVQVLREFTLGLAMFRVLRATHKPPHPFRPIPDAKTHVQKLSARACVLSVYRAVRIIVIVLAAVRTMAISCGRFLFGLCGGLFNATCSSIFERKLMRILAFAPSKRVACLECLECVNDNYDDVDICEC